MLPDEDEEILWVSDPGTLPKRLLLADCCGQIRLLTQAIGGEQTHVELMGPKTMREMVELADQVLAGKQSGASLVPDHMHLAAAVIHLFIENKGLEEDFNQLSRTAAAE